MANITAPVVLDSTGQSMLTQLTRIAVAQETLVGDTIKADSTAYSDFDAIPLNTVVEVDTTAGTNTPDGTANFSGTVETIGIGTGYKTQKAYYTSAGVITDVYYRADAGNGWGAWLRMPARSEITSMNSAISTLNSNLAMVVNTGAGAHNCIYRGKNLGTSVTTAQYTAISNGTFTDLYIGDYWVIGGVNWRIAAFDYWLNTGDSNCTTHHVVIVPDTSLASGPMNDTNITTGAYMGSDFYTGNNDNTAFATVKSTITTNFGSSHILTHREHLTNATADGYASAGTWADSTVELMNERMVYGNAVFENMISGTNVPADYTIDKSQLPLFALEPSRITNRSNWWLRGVASAASFCIVNAYGNCTYSNASDSLGLRPAFAIK